MLTITNPEVFPDLARFRAGLWPIRIQKKTGLTLIIKCPKEMILTAKINRGFRFYLAPMKANDVQTYCLITAFFDDHDEPLTIRTPLFEDDMAADTFDIHFFDEHNRELLGYHASNQGVEKFRAMENVTRFVPGTYDLTRQFEDEMLNWFGHRTSIDDNDSLLITFEKAIFPENLFIQDATPEANSYHGYKVPMHTMLEREEPGPFQELDIVKLLQRVFTNNQIYLNPLRPDDGKEFLDALVVTPENAFFIQAKDSPNIERILKQNVDRKKSAVASHLKKAINQMRGSISYSRLCKPLKLTTGGQLHEISLEGRAVWGLIIVKELFNSEFSIYSPPVLALARETEVPCFILDYRELHEYTWHLPTEQSFIDALKTVLEVALQRNEFPRLRFGLIPPDKI